ncbi:MAG: sigma-54-dependent Fis family transcriptional regulator [Magnetococcales bacterium]|nr:sigma-54-dependent Fis family transcriptional regulator [Magnetococcales bacterium]
MDEQQETGRLLIVDDEPIAVRNLEHVMKKEGYHVMTAGSGAAALKLLWDREFDVILTDLRMDQVDGMGVLEVCRQRHPDSEVIILTGYATLSSAVEAVKQGAFSYIAKPFRLDEVRQTTAEALKKVRFKKESRHWHQQLNDQQVAGSSDNYRIMTHDPEMLRLIDMARQIAPTDCNVLITGGSGVGKELFARFIHETSSRPDKPFVAINCAAFNESLLENELFGHARGAFTGAVSDHRGVIESAQGGTLFLDEVAEMSPSMQVKLLRVIQEREVRRLGENTDRKIDLRFIAATNRNLSDEMRQERFRRDFYYRINVASFDLPPLACRQGDIPLLCYHFLHHFSARFHRQVTEIAWQTMDLLRHYPYPGNVRELRNIIERGVAMARDHVLRPEHLPDHLRDLPVQTIRRQDGQLRTLEEREREYVLWVFKNEAHGNQTVAARILGIDRVSLWRKLKKYQEQQSDGDIPSPSISQEREG